MITGRDKVFAVEVTVIAESIYFFRWEVSVADVFLPVVLFLLRIRDIRNYVA